NLGSFTAGTELVFGIYVTNTGYVYSMGPGSRNPDGLMHATVDFIAPGVANVGFEDLYGGGDMDYNDNIFQFRGSIAPDPHSNVPEPATMALFGIGGLVMAFVRRNRR
nr:PEP-CTERM sorting domain-containing protein [Candidatus Omnitrophota bacterium]